MLPVRLSDSNAFRRWLVLRFGGVACVGFSDSLGVRLPLPTLATSALMALAGRTMPFTVR